MPKKILIVDDDDFYNEVISTTVKLFLRQDVVVARTEDEGWDLALSAKPGLLIVNLDMPGKSGFELVERIRDSVETKGLPVLALSSHRDRKEQALGAGCTSFMHKPFRTRELEAEIVRLLKQP